MKGPLIQSDKGVNKIPNLIQPSQISFNYTSQTSTRRSGSGTTEYREQREGGRLATINHGSPAEGSTSILGGPQLLLAWVGGGGGRRRYGTRGVGEAKH